LVERRGTRKRNKFENRNRKLVILFGFIDKKCYLGM
jgi:hypothetical protein